MPEVNSGPPTYLPVFGGEAGRLEGRSLGRGKDRNFVAPRNDKLDPEVWTICDADYHKMSMQSLEGASLSWKVGYGANLEHSGIHGL